MLKYLLGAAVAAALLLATPAAACGDCKNCPHGKKDTVAASEEKKDAGCACAKSGGECKCGDKCACANCPVHGKKAEKKEEKKS